MVQKNANGKIPNNLSNDLQNNIIFGNALDEWEDEFETGECIDEIVTGSAKSFI